MTAAARYDLPADTDVLWEPHAGPQSVFLASDAYEALYGGAAGGGKSDALLFGGLRQIDHPGYRALILRRSFPELSELMERAHGVFPQLGGVWNEQKKRYVFGSGAMYGFGYCETYNDVLQYQGKQFTRIAVDELGQWPEERMWTYLMSRNRTAARGLTLEMRASANPGGPGHHWLKKRFISLCPASGESIGVVNPRDASISTRAFVPAKLSDNPTLMDNDPLYGQRLANLNDLEYKWLAEGDWDAGEGLALSELNRARHLKRGIEIPEHWTIFAGFDWGYAHPFSFGLYAADEDGTVYLIDSCSGRRLQPPAIAERILDCLDTNGIALSRLRIIWAGHDCWADVRARAENIPTIFEHFVRLGLPLAKANISRIAGVQNCRRYLAWKNTDGTEFRPRFVMRETPNNIKAFDCLESRVSDPDNPEDVLKVNADENGENGDDFYDQWRYALASRPIAAKAQKQHPEQDRSPLMDPKTFKIKRISAREEIDRELAQGAKVAYRQSVRPPRWPR